MDRAEKTRLVEDVREKFSKARAAFVTDYRGIKATELDEFRRALKENSNEFKIVRNTLVRRALEGTDVEHLSEHFKGTTAVVFSYEDAVGAAKTLTEYAGKYPALAVKTGTLGTKVIGPEEIKALSRLPGREELLGRLLGSLNSPISGLAGVLGGVPRKLLYALNAVKAQKEAA